MRSFTTLQAALPVSDATAQVLQEWSQQTQHRQHEASSQAATAISRKPAAKRRRRQLNIVSSPGSKAHASQPGHGAATPTAINHQNMMSDSISHRGSFPQQHQGNARPSPRAAPRPSGTRVRSLATAEMLLSHAHLLQQLQRKSPPLSSHSSAAAAQAHNAEQAQRAAARYSCSGQTRPQPAPSPSSAPETMAQHASAAEQDMLALQVDLVDNQLPHWSQKQPLDWSAQQDISIYQPQVRAAASKL